MISATMKTFSFESWNLRGLGDDDKCVVARDAITLANPTVCCIQETKLASVTDAKARSFLPSTMSHFK